MELLAQIENSAFGVWVRESGSMWSYASILFLHTVGLSFLVGLNLAIDLRLLGVARRLPVTPMERFYRIMWMGFWINAASGVALLIADATTKFPSPIFAVKMTSITLALIVMVVIRRRLFRVPNLDVEVPAIGKTLAVISILCWLGAITAGRLLAYFG